ncbi:hypothetical protein AKO1_009678 [Acrasis kona]|uniref:G-patch domain-containing protein n=1 Tax=Acrasis kona TaxID=1008807 RepID=A0AAW2ZMR7_9EUKA
MSSSIRIQNSPPSLRDEIDLSLTRSDLFLNIRNKIYSLIKQTKADQKEVTFTFPPLLNEHRAFIHRLCDELGVYHESGSAIRIPDDVYASIYCRKGTTLKEMSITIPFDDDVPVVEPDDELLEIFSAVGEDDFVEPQRRNRQGKNTRMKKAKNRKARRQQNSSDSDSDELDDFGADELDDLLESSLQFAITEDIDDTPTPIEIVMNALKAEESRKKAEKSALAAMARRREKETIKVRSNQLYSQSKHIPAKKTPKKRANDSNRGSPAAATVFVSAGVMPNTLGERNVQHAPSSPSPSTPPSFRMHQEHGQFIHHSGVGGSVMSMMAKMGYEQGRGLGKDKQGIVNPITVSHVEGKVFRVNCDFDEAREEISTKQKKRSKSMPIPPVARSPPKASSLPAEIEIKSSPESRPSSIQIVDPFMYVDENEFVLDGLTHCTFLEKVQDRLQLLCNLTLEQSKPVAHLIAAPSKTTEDIKLRNLCRMWKVRCDKKPNCMLQLTTNNLSCRPGDDDSSDSEQEVSDSEQEEKVKHIKKSKGSAVDLTKASHSEFLNFVEHKLVELLESSSQQDPVVVYNFPAINDGHRRTMVTSICRRCNIGSELLAERKLSTRSARNKKLMNLAMSNPEAPVNAKLALQGSVVQVTVTHGVSIKPHRQLINAVLSMCNFTESPSKKKEKERKKSLHKKSETLSKKEV